MGFGCHFAPRQFRADGERHELLRIKSDAIYLGHHVTI
jgi:hypothetical protein